MNREVSKSVFKARALQLLREVEATGQRLVITDRGKPAIEVRPYEPTEHDALKDLRGSVLSFDRPLDPVGEEDWERADRIDPP